ncbi:MAG: hypothetical protein PHP93_07865 [Kiritimatiellales bacterium]|nr:hypothetical protein [Kiritimatiellales bacterium]
MSELSIVSFLIGLLALAIGVISMLKPARVLADTERFPRSTWPGRILAAIDLIWAAYNLTLMHLGIFDAWKVHLFWIVPVAIYLCVKYLDELLSPRALGGLFLLAAGPVLAAARWHPSDWRLVITVIAYLWILLGLTFLLEPWWFRRLMPRLVGTNNLTVRIGGGIKTLIGLGLIALALFIY